MLDLLEFLRLYDFCKMLATEESMMTDHGLFSIEHWTQD